MYVIDITLIFETYVIYVTLIFEMYRIESIDITLILFIHVHRHRCDFSTGRAKTFKGPTGAKNG